MGQGKIFLTGATGLLGSRLLLEILSNTNQNIICLVRAHSDQEAHLRVEKALRCYQPRLTPRRIQERVWTIAGDLALPSWGLSESLFERLKTEVQTFIHSAASTSLIGERNEILKQNWRPMQGIIKFLSQVKEARLVYVSSFSVAGDRIFDPQTNFTEQDLNIGQEFPMMPYQESKYLSEFEVRRQNDVDWMIHRPGQIFADSKTGVYPAHLVHSSLFNDFITSVLSFGAVPDSDWYFDMTPVDKVAQGIVELSIQSWTSGLTSHLVDPEPPRIKDLSVLLGLPRIPLSEFQEALRQGRTDSPAFRSLKLWMKTLKKNFNQRMRVSCHDTQKRLSFSLQNDHAELFRRFEYLKATQCPSSAEMT